MQPKSKSPKTERLSNVLRKLATYFSFSFCFLFLEELGGGGGEFWLPLLTSSPILCPSR